MCFWLFAAYLLLYLTGGVILIQTSTKRIVSRFAFYFILYLVLGGICALPFVFVVSPVLSPEPLRVSIESVAQHQCHWELKR